MNYMHQCSLTELQTINTIRNENNEIFLKQKYSYNITLSLSLSALNKVHFPEQVRAFITVGSLESHVSVLKLNSHMFIIKVNPHVCSERQRREERDIVNDVEDDK